MKRKTLTAAVAAVVALGIGCSPSKAMMTMMPKTYDEQQKNEHLRQMNRSYLAGVFDGLRSYNVQLLLSEKHRYFCLPPKLVLTVEQAENIMHEWVEAHPGNDTTVDSALLYGLVDTFPCNDSPKFWFRSDEAGDAGPRKRSRL